MSLIETPVKLANELVLFISRWSSQNIELDYALQYYNPYVPFGTVAVYALIVTFLGPWLMRNRKPYNLNTQMILFNLFIIFVNGYISLMASVYIYRHWTNRCIVNERSMLPVVKEVFTFAFTFHLSKYADLLDTIFFVLRKKQNQISFLHVFHHCLALIISYYPMFEVKFGFYMLVALCFNSGVHVMTYSYYFLAAFGPKIQKYLWWKRYLTMVQIVQFWVILGYTFYAMFTGCEQFTVSFSLVVTFLLCLNLLFVNYYFQNFWKIRNKKSI